eukprot:TRINITY_DN35948_c0_g1_i1.p1 TRINITY_DN35948_c0_g1~~TRINITY_DN35948_c0_g1_i1.p1  ORF type:complete len:361 (-),score=45.91 TRINITY_DN35948_c0_g1_i1:117-1130(-)
MGTSFAVFPTPMRGHHGDVTCVEWSPDGARIASASKDANVKIWDSATGKEETVLSAACGGGPVHSCSWNADSTLLACAGTDVEVWDVSAVSCRERTEGRQGHPIRCVAFCKAAEKSSLLAYGIEKTVVIWDAESGDEVAELTGHGHRIVAVAWNADGSRLASACHDGHVKIWNMETFECTRDLPGVHTVRDVVWSADAASTLVVTALSNGTCKTWCCETGAIKNVHGDVTRNSMSESHRDWVTSVDWSKDGQFLVTGGGDDRVILWNYATGKILRNFEGHRAKVNSVCFSPCGQFIASGSSDKSVRVWCDRSDIPKRQTGLRCEATGEEMRDVYRPT